MRLSWNQSFLLSAPYYAPHSQVFSGGGGEYYNPALRTAIGRFNQSELYKKSINKYVIFQNVKSMFYLQRDAIFAIVSIAMGKYLYTKQMQWLSLCWSAFVLFLPRGCSYEPG